MIHNVVELVLHWATNFLGLVHYISTFVLSSDFMEILYSSDFVGTRNDQSARDISYHSQ